MNEETKKRLAKSLTSDTADIIPYLPYLLKDFFSLASDPSEMADLLKSHTNFGKDLKLLDLACGKGAVSIHLAKEFDCVAKGIDIISEFIEEGKKKAEEFGVSDRCIFVCGDVNEAISFERDFDLTVWGGAGDLLGGYKETLKGIAKTVKKGGYILLDDGYVQGKQHSLRFKHEYLTKDEWDKNFKENGLTVIACNAKRQEAGEAAYDEDLGNIRKRAEELILKYPEKREMFQNYVKSQQAEYEDLQDGITPALWLLKKD